MCVSTPNRKSDIESHTHTQDELRRDRKALQKPDSMKRAENERIRTISQI